MLYISCNHVIFLPFFDLNQVEEVSNDLKVITAKVNRAAAMLRLYVPRPSPRQSYTTPSPRRAAPRPYTPSRKRELAALPALEVTRAKVFMPYQAASSSQASPAAKAAGWADVVGKLLTVESVHTV